MILNYPPPCLVHQWSVPRVWCWFEGFGRKVRSKPPPPAQIRCSFCISRVSRMPLFSTFFRFIFWSRFLSLPGGPWPHFGSHFTSMFSSKIRFIFWLISITVYYLELIFQRLWHEQIHNNTNIHLIVLSFSPIHNLLKIHSETIDTIPSRQSVGDWIVSDHCLLLGAGGRGAGFQII